MNVEGGEEESGADSDLMAIPFAVRVRVTQEQVTAAVEAFFDDNGDIGGYEITGATTLPDGTVQVVGEAYVESGMSAMEWGGYVDRGILTVDVELPIVDPQSAP
ncbi:MAG: hypothetical protein Q8M17_05325 [Actinomycetota bacterium]|nr:hypothetical protein [Actinomycetota bacterium]